MRSSEDLLEAFFAHLRATTTGTAALAVCTPVAGIADLGELVRAIRVAELRGYLRNVSQIVGRWFVDLTDAGAEMLGRSGETTRAGVDSEAGGRSTSQQEAPGRSRTVTPPGAGSRTPPSAGAGDLSRAGRPS